MKWYIGQLEQTVIDACQLLDVPNAVRSQKYPGIWIADEKVRHKGTKISKLTSLIGQIIGLRGWRSQFWLDRLSRIGLELQHRPVMVNSCLII